MHAPAPLEKDMQCYIRVRRGLIKTHRPLTHDDAMEVCRAASWVSEEPPESIFDAWLSSGVLVQISPNHFQLSNPTKLQLSGSKN